jgi:lysophospholipase L1-like esterase
MKLNRILLLATFLIASIFSCINSKRVNQENLDNLYPTDSAVVVYHSEWTKNNYRERIKEFKRSPLKTGDIVFIGDSNTEYAKYLFSNLDDPKVKNRGISGDVTEGVLKRLDEITYFKPKAVFILIGTNDLFNFCYQKQIPSVEYIINNIFKITGIIHDKSPETKIFLQTILPNSDTFVNENINKANAMIKSNGKEKKYELIDLNASFLDEDGSMNKELTYDGTHLNKAGYAVWVTVIKPYVDLN